jgi:PAS domain S-box-containing protein
MKVLIVDDDIASRKILIKNLEYGGHHAKSASNGKEALKMARESLPDIIISDILMPEMDGFKLLREVKNDEQLRKIPFVFYSATYVDKKDKDLATDMGASHFIIKPVETDEFLKTINELIQRTREQKLDVPETPFKDEHELSEIYEERITIKLQKKVNELKLLEKIFSNLNDAVMIIDTKGFYVKQNSTHAALFGYSDDKLRGRTPGILFGYKAFPKLLKKLSKNGIVHEGLVALTKRREKLNIDLIVFPGFDDNGKVFCYVGILRDITEKIRAEAEKKNLWVQLLQVQKFESIGRLAGGIAHDFNNLLSSILGSCNLAAKEIPEDHPLMKHCKTIEKCCLEGGKLIKQLLAFSRSQVLEMELYNLNTIIEKMVDMFSRVIGEDIKLSLDLNKNISAIKVDESQIGQVLMNLVVNASDAMPDGGSLKIETKDVSLDKEFIKNYPDAVIGKYVMLSLTDNGIGMSKEVKESIFEPYFTTKEEGKGSGLGLSTVMGIIKQHNGYILAESEVGKGTTFNIYLPVIEDKVSS